MANRKKHIHGETELLKAMRLMGYCFPTNEIEQKISLKLQPSLDIAALAKKIDPSGIWEQEDPIPYKQPRTGEVKLDISFGEQWGIAARGSAEISAEIMDKIRKRQSDQDSHGGNSKT